jgi:hypothetical protein
VSQEAEMAYDPPEDYDDDEGGTCAWCGGDGYADCDDPLGCGEPGHLDDYCCPCTACHGTGLAEHQWIF